MEKGPQYTSSAWKRVHNILWKEVHYTEIDPQYTNLIWKRVHKILAQYGKRSAIY